MNEGILKSSFKTIWSSKIFMIIISNWTVTLVNTWHMRIQGGPGGSPPPLRSVSRPPLDPPLHAFFLLQWQFRGLSFLRSTVSLTSLKLIKSTVIYNLQKPCCTLSTKQIFGISVIISMFTIKHLIQSNFF